MAGADGHRSAVASRDLGEPLGHPEDVLFCEKTRERASFDSSGVAMAGLPDRSGGVLAEEAAEDDGGGLSEGRDDPPELVHRRHHLSHLFEAVEPVVNVADDADRVERDAREQGGPVERDALGDLGESARVAGETGAARLHRARIEGGLLLLLRHDDEQRQAPMEPEREGGVMGDASLWSEHNRTIGMVHAQPRILLDHFWCHQ